MSPAALPPVASAGLCMHATATLGPHARPACAAGVVYQDLAGSGPGWAARLPCYALQSHAKKPPVPCDQRREPTETEIAAWDAASERRLNDVFEAAARVLKQHAETGAYEGQVECPACGKGLRWTMARSNKHVHGACQTKECVLWMQ